VPETIPVLSAWTKRPVPVVASPTPAPGLWVGIHGGGGCIIVHRRSQRVVGRYPDAEAALACAVQIGPLADWAGCDDPCVSLPLEACDQIDSIVKRWGGEGVSVAGRRSR